MLKITAILSLLIIVSQADFRRFKRDADASSDYDTGTVWSQGISCESCGSECLSACGTRHFRSCCFNYLRRKRPDTTKMRYYFNDGRRPQMLPVFTENLPDDRYNWVTNERNVFFDGDDRD